MTTTLAPEIFSKVREFAEFHFAYTECNEETRQIVDEMLQLLLKEGIVKDEKIREAIKGTPLANPEGMSLMLHRLDVAKNMVSTLPRH